MNSPTITDSLRMEGESIVKEACKKRPASNPQKKKKKVNTRVTSRGQDW